MRRPRILVEVSGCPTRRVVLADEAIFVASQFENVYLETSWGDLPRIKEGIAMIGPERLMFGSDCPIQEIGSQMRPIEVLGWEPPMGMSLRPDQVEGILGDNLLALLAKSDRP